MKLRRAPADEVVVGTLAEQDRRVYLEYDASFIATGLQLSPYKLPLRTGLIEHREHAFGPLPGLFDDSLPDGWGLRPPRYCPADAGRRLRDQARRWTGMPVGIGIARSKTLAKLANHLAKNDPLPAQPDGVCVLVHPEQIEAALKRVRLKDLWGISGGNIRRLMQLGISTPIGFSRADLNHVREHLGVVGQRMAYELRGEHCLPLESMVPDRKNICVSRSFASTVKRYDELRESVVTFAAQAAAVNVGAKAWRLAGDATTGSPTAATSSKPTARAQGRQTAPQDSTQRIGEPKGWTPTPAHATVILSLRFYPAGRHAFSPTFYTTHPHWAAFLICSTHRTKM